MLIADVKKLSPLERFLYWIEERESIRLKKEAGEPKPWTDDTILQTYRFCNVRRMDDKVSKWLLDNWYAPYFDDPNMLVAIGLARFFNKPESLSKITKLVFGGKYLPNSVKATMRRLRGDGMTIWNPAYMVRGNDGVDKVESVVDYNVQPLLKLRGKLDTSSMEQTWNVIKDSYGFGSFMAGQVVADLRWAVSGLWGDRYVWAPIGPGSMKGMNYLHGRPPKTTLKQEQFLKELLAVQVVLADKLPDIASRLEAHDVQNCCCEYSKYTRTLLGEGKPKQLYQGI